MVNLASGFRAFVLGFVAVFSLLLQAYVGAVFFILCIIIERVLVFVGSSHSLDSLLAEWQNYYQYKLQHYKDIYTQLEQQHFKIDWFK